LLRRTDAGHHEEMGRLVGSRAQDDFSTSPDPLDLPVARIFNTDRARAFEDDASSLGAHEHREVLAFLHDRMQIGPRRTGATARLGGELHAADAVLYSAVLIPAGRQPQA